MPNSHDLTREFNDSLSRLGLVAGRDKRNEFIEQFYAKITLKIGFDKFFIGVDMKKQKDMLFQSILVILSCHNNMAIFHTYMEKLATKHRNMGIKKSHCDAWLECLLETVKQVDTEYTDETKIAWEEIMGEAVNYLRVAVNA